MGRVVVCRGVSQELCPCHSTESSDSHLTHRSREADGIPWFLQKASPKQEKSILHPFTISGFLLSCSPGGQRRKQVSCPPIGAESRTQRAESGLPRTGSRRMEKGGAFVGPHSTFRMCSSKLKLQSHRISKRRFQVGWDRVFNRAVCRAGMEAAIGSGTCLAATLNPLVCLPVYC